MKKGFFKRFTSTLIAGIMLLNSNPIPMPSFADTDTQGIGIYNHVMTTAETTETEYVLKFYKTGGTDENPIYEPVRLTSEIDF